MVGYVGRSSGTLLLDINPDVYNFEPKLKPFFEPMVELPDTFEKRVCALRNLECLVT